jgi:branched-subunit amino acid ABC-type transport system permease component
MLPLGDFIHLGITGIAQGCAYGLIALGFVLIYKATEVVNFAHGEFMMLGAFAVLTLSRSSATSSMRISCVVSSANRRRASLS